MAGKSDEIIFTGQGDRDADRQVQRLAAKGEYRKLYERVYTTNLSEPLATVGNRHHLKIAAGLVKGGILAGRSSFEARGTIIGAEDGSVAWLFLNDPLSKTPRDIKMPGVVIRMTPGPGPQPGDYPYLGLLMPSRARAMLENLVASRARGQGPTRTVGSKGVEAKLDQICRQDGEEGLNAIRDQARTLSAPLGLSDEMQRLDEIIGAILGTRQAKLSNPAAKARAKGEAYDPECVGRLTKLMQHLNDVALPERTDASIETDRRVASCFIEAYFSNYIEGTRFPVRQAARIIFEDEVVARRPKDSHDVLATYRQIIELGQRLPSSLTAEEFIDEICTRHADLMAVRPENEPGQFKREVNIAGNTTFVQPDLVKGTLRAGVEMLVGLSHPFAKASFIHFLMTDVHPFVDGNGRLSRIMMTKELVGANLSRIVIPTVYRDNYLSGLRALSRHGDPAPLVRSLDFCQKVTVATSAPRSKAVDVWASTYAFVEGGLNARLEMPDPSRQIVWKDEVPAPADYWEAEANPPNAFVQ